MLSSLRGTTLEILSVPSKLHVIPSRQKVDGILANDCCVCDIDIL